MASYQKKTVRIPIEYELGNLDKQIKQMRDSLDTVKPNTSAFKELNTILSRVQKEFNLISAEAQGTFSSQSQIDSFTKKVQIMSNYMSLFGDKFDKLASKEFSPNFFPKELITNFENATKKVAELEQEISNIKKQSFSSTIKSSNELVNTLSKIKLTADDDPTVILSKLETASRRTQASLTKATSELKAQEERTRSLREELEKLNQVRNERQTKVDSTQQRVNDLESELAKQERASKKSKSKLVNETIAPYDAQLDKLKELKKALSGHMSGAQRQQSSIVGEIFSEGAGGFNENKTNLINYLKKNFTIDGTVLSEIQNYTMPQLRELMNNLIKGVLAERDSALQGIQVEDGSVKQLKEELSKAKQELDTYKEELKSAQKDATSKEREINTSSSKTTKKEEEIKGLTEASNEYAGAIDKVREAQENANNAANNSKEASELSKTREQVQSYGEELNKAVEEQKNFAKSASNSKDALDGIGAGASSAQKELDRLVKAQARLDNIKNAVKHWLGFTEVINLSKRAISGMISHIHELDDVMTQIAIVTDFTQNDLWNQMSTYSDMAREYGVSIKGVYEVSQLWYQQGLKTNDVMTLTEETLKMAKIAGISYSDAADYMTVSIRAFNMEMSEAQRITDVYSKVAAISATDTEELAVAMSKTASSANSVNSSFENTTSMMAVMIGNTVHSYCEVRLNPEYAGKSLSFNYQSVTMLKIR